MAHFEPPSSGGPSAELARLPRLLVVDPEGGGGTENGAFSGLQTYLTLAAAIAGAVDGARFLIMPGDYTGEGELTWEDMELTFEATGPSSSETFLPPFTGTGSSSATIVNAVADAVTMPLAASFERSMLGGAVEATNISLLECEATEDAELTGDVRADLFSFNNWGASGANLTGTMDIVDARPIPGQLYVDPDAYAHGNGSPAAPLQTLASAIDLAPSLPLVTQIFLAPADYTPEGPTTYTDKRLSIIGGSLFNQSGSSTPTHGVTLRPTSSDNSPMILEVTRTNCNIIPQSQGIIGFFFEAYAEIVSDNAHFGTFYFEGSADTMRAGSEGTIVSSIYGSGVGLAETILNGELFLKAGSEVNGALTLTNLGIPRSVVKETLIKFPISCSHPLELWNCTFPLDGSPVVITGGTVTTDLATYARGVEVGVTWPENVSIIDVDVTLQPFRAASGTGSNSAGNPTPAYPVNVLGDLFVCEVNGVGGTAPTLPAGWTKQQEQTGGGIISQLWTRDARATGSDAGTITVTAGGGFPTQAQIHAFRNVATSSFIQSITSTTTTSAGPTTPIAGPTVPASGLGWLAVCCNFSNGTTPTATTITGQTGGTWADRAQFESGLGALMDLQTAALGDGATVTGGTCSLPGTRVNQIAFALVGAVT